MTKVSIIALLIVALAVTIGVAREKDGIGGTVYDNNGSPAGSSLDTIYIWHHTIKGDSADHYYNSGTSYWVTNSDYDLYEGYWNIQGHCNGYHSQVYTCYYEPGGRFVEQDIHCDISD